MARRQLAAERRPGRPRRLIGLLVFAAGVGACAPIVVGAAAASRPACFGAAARDAAHPCANPRTRLTVRPSPGEAQITPNAPCRPIQIALNICGFGSPTASAATTIALVGNSHAGHWRAALEVAAKALRWQGLSITRSSCPLMQATISLPEPKRVECSRWTQGVVGWFAQHPEVSTLFVSDQPTPPLVAPGHSVLAAEVDGYIGVWNALPATVSHIFVIRDNPYARGNTLACVERAMAKREPAGLGCAIRRSLALKADPQAIAAQQLHSPRVRVIDLSRFFCDSRLCYPVIGGALVYKDPDHLTRVFAATLGPYLLREVRRFMASWR